MTPTVKTSAALDLQQILILGAAIVMLSLGMRHGVGLYPQPDFMLRMARRLWLCLR